MKNIKKIFLIVCCLNFLYLNVNASSATGDNSCDYTVRYIKGGNTSISYAVPEDETLKGNELKNSYEEYINLLHNTGWNTYAYVCNPNPSSCTRTPTACKYTTAEVNNWPCYEQGPCSEVTSSVSPYKHYTQTITSTQCSSIRVPCEEPPATLCQVKCTATECPRTAYGSYYCSGGVGANYRTCIADGGTWTRDSWTEYDAEETESFGGTGGVEITIAQGVSKMKSGHSTCKGTFTCEEEYWSTTITRCTLASCSIDRVLVKGARDFAYSIGSQFSGDSVVAYCANPSQKPLLGTGEFNSGRKVDIDIMKCAASDSSLDCGVANILSEAAYRNEKMEVGMYNQYVISLAIRMWYAYKEQAGFDLMGIAPEDDNTINDIYQFLDFYPGLNGEYPNVYKQTLDGIRRNLFFDNFNDATLDYNFTGATISNLKGIACSVVNNDSNVGVFCNGSSGDTYKYAAFLLVNTIQGNKYMKEHFTATMGGFSTALEGEELKEAISNKYNDPEYYNVILSEDGRTATINYELRETVEIDCNTLDSDTANNLGCDMEDQTLVFKDSNGNVITQEQIEKYDYCNKNFCTVTVQLNDKIECESVSKVELKFKGFKTCGSSSIRKYISCTDIVGDQIMYSFEKDNCSSDVDKSEITLPGAIECPGGCQEEAISNPISVNCTDIYKYDADKYNNGNLRTTGSGYYFNSGTLAENQVGVKYEFNKNYMKYKVSDPSLTCILNKRSTTRDYYDYSTYFGVNTNFCRVYCSDSVEYYLPPRTEVSNSLQLKYDVVPGKKYNDNYLIGNIKTKRNCVSKIFYDDFEFSGKQIDWNAAYGLDPDISINNWKELYDAVYDLSKTQGNKKDFLHNLVYDLYNCNFFTDNEIKDAGVIKPSDAGKNSREYVNDYLNNTKTYCNNNDCTSAETKFEGGADYIDPNLDRVGGSYTEYGHPVLYDNSTVKNSVSFKYCKTTDKCFEKNTDADAERPYEDRFDSKAKNKQYMLNNYMVSASGLGNVKVPTNDYVIFTYEVDGVVYNDTSYQVEQQTGKVQVYKSSDKDKYNKIAENTFPTSYYSDALCNERSVNYDINDDGKVNSKDKERYCMIDVNVYNHIYTTYNTTLEKNLSVNAFYRKTNDDAFIQSIKNSSKYTCEFTIKPDPIETPIGFVFRNIELNSPVPTDTGDRSQSTVFKNSNWDLSNTDDSEYNSRLQEVINQIKGSSEDLYGRDKYLEYSFILDDNSIRSIREYNDNNKDYASIKDSTGATTLDSCKKEDGKYFECQSKFVEQLNTYGVKVIKGDGLSQYTDCKNNPSGEGCVD